MLRCKSSQGPSSEARSSSTGGPLPEGRRVAIYVEEDEGFPLDETSKRGLAEAMAQFERGEALTPEQVFARLRSGR